MAKSFRRPLGRFLLAGILATLILFPYYLHSSLGSTQNNFHPVPVPNRRVEGTQHEHLIEPRVLDSFWIPSKPDPVVWDHLSFAWKNESSDGLSMLHNDPYLRALVMRRGEDDPSSFCPPTSQMRLDIALDGWLLRSFGPDGVAKTIGGDEYYISYYSGNDDNVTPSAVAHVTDLQDGTYRLNFVATPFHKPQETTNNSMPLMGRLSVELQYTCGFGKLPHGTKTTWTTGGVIMTNYSVTLHPQQAPRIQPYKRIPKTPDFTKYDWVLFYGDSNVEVMEACSRWKANYTRFLGKPVNPLTQKSLQSKFLPDIRHPLQQDFDNSSKIALVVGSSTWDIVFGVKHGRDLYKHHLEACRTFVLTLREEFPTSHVYWFMGLAMHPHQARVVPKWQNIQALKYLSQSRALDLYRRQSRLMRQLGVPVLDFFEESFLSAHLMTPGDARHYKAQFFSNVLQNLYHHPKTSK